ncbi:MAG: hypothetical protein HY924_09405 [Elusimicrobia bacterium]|nr:hypothetical protein [Elusimicrobiota bacterium]
MKPWNLLPLILTASLAAAPAFAAKASKAAPAAEDPAMTVRPVTGLKALDMPYDAGEGILVRWDVMPHDEYAAVYVVELSSVSAAGPWVKAKEVRSDQGTVAELGFPFWARPKAGQRAVEVKPLDLFSNDSDAAKARVSKAEYFVRVRATNGRQVADSEVVTGRAESDWFSMPRLNNLIFTLVFCGIVLWFISHARKKDLFLRRIPGLDAVEDAIGRATEMGRPIYFLTGRLDIDSISTIAASLILGEIAKRIAQYDTQLKVPHTYAMTMAVCQEITKQAYSEAGRPDAYREDINFFITEDQFAYTAAVNGMMVREKPAACFYMGYYYAESLLLTEVGASVGAIQIAGSDSEHQLPFFFITCDYTLIGEELYAAGAYLSRNPVLVGTLRGQDVGKAFVMLSIFFGVAFATLGVLIGREGWVTTMLEIFKSY